ncbi:MAG: serine hydrolase domain-containing protein [Chloroflexota bacterium]
MDIPCAQAQGESFVPASIDTLMSDLRERGLFSGAVVVGKGDEILYEGGFGLANVAEGVPFTPGTPSNGASLGKTLTAAAILMLHEDGRIDLDDPVTQYLPEFPYPEVTVRHLITHSSGLHPDNVYFTFLAPQAETWTNEGLLEILIEHEPPLAFPPGSGFVYNGTGFNMAAILMERVRHAIGRYTAREDSTTRRATSTDGSRLSTRIRS